MSKIDERTRIRQNLHVIREYLMGEFKGFELTEDRSTPLDCHKFTLRKPKSEEHYKLKVTWPRLSDGDHSPERNKVRLVTEGVADKMRARHEGEYFTWGDY